MFEQRSSVENPMEKGEIGQGAGRKLDNGVNQLYWDEEIRQNVPL